MWLTILALMFVQEGLTYRPKEGQVKYKFTLFLLPIIFFGMVIASFLEYFIFRRSNLGLSVTGFVLCLFSIIIRQISIKELGPYFSEDIEIKPKHRLIKTGIYKHIRHPIYFSSLLLVMGFPLILNSFYALALVPAAVVVIWIRMELEEKVLLAYFGKEYKEYIKTTKKIIPGIY